MPKTTSRTDTYEFTVSGPFEVPVILAGRNRDVRRIDDRRLPQWWNKRLLAALRSEIGCYVFGLSVGRGIRPIYVGMTTRSFKSECFNALNLRRLEHCLADNRGTLVLFLVKYPRGRGRVSGKAIRKLEDQLIGLAYARNQDLLNKHGTREDRMPAIRGVLRSRQGQPSKAAGAFKRMIAVDGRRD